MKKQFSLIYLLGALFFFTSCEGDDPFGNLNEAEQKLIEYYLDAEAALSNVYNLSEQALRSGLQNGDTVMMDGATVYKASDKVSVNYGNGVVSSDGLTRSGMFIITETGDYFQGGGQISVDFQGYTVEEKLVTGQIGVDNTGNNVLALTANGFSVDSGFTIGVTKNILWTQGYNTQNDPTDDLYQLSGTGQGNDADGNSLTTTITSPLAFSRKCEYGIESGVMNVDFAMADTSSAASSGSLDFVSDDGCDNVVKITLEVNGSMVTLTQQFKGF